MPTKIFENGNDLLTVFLRQANIDSQCVYVTFEDGKITIMRDEDNKQESEEDIVFDALDYILNNATDDELNDVMYTLEEEMADRGIF